MGYIIIINIAVRKIRSKFIIFQQMHLHSRINEGHN
jgi:hypothetical protein